jgi:uncharacterized membrane protein
MSISCGYCGAEMPDISEFCPSCGRPVREGTSFAPDPEEFVEAAREEEVEEQRRRDLPPVELSDRFVGALAYLTFVPALFFIFLSQFHGRKFVRFHAFQSVFFWGVAIVLLAAGFFTASFGWLIIWLVIGALVLLGLVFTWGVLSIKALQGEYFELPWLGALAEQQAER